MRWDSLVTPALTLYVQPGGWGDANRAALLARVERSLAHALGMLGASAYPAHARVFALDSKAQMALVTGQSHNGTTDAGAHAVLVVASAAWSPFDRHELMHMASLTLWGEPGRPTSRAAWRRSGWLREGLAAAAEDRCGAWTNRGVAAAMQAGGERLSLAQLTESFYEQDDLAAYLQAGSLVGYLLETRGRPRFRELWRAGPDGLARVYGASASELESGWRAWLADTPLSARPPSLAALREAGCGSAEPDRGS